MSTKLIRAGETGGLKGRAVTESPAAKGDRPPVMLVIGDIGRWVAKGRELPLLENCTFAAPWEISSELLNKVQPEIVVSGLTDGLVDAIEIAQSLDDLGFTGAYRAITQSLPNPDAVRREVRAVAPGIDFDILILAS